MLKSTEIAKLITNRAWKWRCGFVVDEGTRTIETIGKPSDDALASLRDRHACVWNGRIAVDDPDLPGWTVSVPIQPLIWEPLGIHRAELSVEDVAVLDATLHKHPEAKVWFCGGDAIVATAEFRPVYGRFDWIDGATGIRLSPRVVQVVGAIDES